MIEFNYKNIENYWTLTKYLAGFILMYVITVTYFLNERKNLNYLILSGFIFMCIMFSVPLIKVILRVFFEKIVVTEREFNYYKNFAVTTMPWDKVQYFIRLPSRGFLVGLIIAYEIGDFKKKFRFDSTISEREKLVKFIHGHVNKLRHVRKTFR